MAPRVAPTCSFREKAEIVASRTSARRDPPLRWMGSRHRALRLPRGDLYQDGQKITQGGCMSVQAGPAHARDRGAPSAHGRVVALPLTTAIVLGSSSCIRRGRPSRTLTTGRRLPVAVLFAVPVAKCLARDVRLRAARGPAAHHRRASPRPDPVGARSLPPDCYYYPRRTTVVLALARRARWPDAQRGGYSGETPSTDAAEL